MGSRKNEDILYGLANLVSLCAACHAAVHLDPATSYEEGWIVHSWDSPEDVPLKDPDPLEF